MSAGKFGTAINCIDGRTQLPVIEWLMENFHLDFVDMITHPGPDKLLSQGRPSELEAMKAKVLISIKAHGSNVVAVTGHYDCAGNPVAKDEHLSQIKRATEFIHSFTLPIKVVGLWINENWKIEIVE
ncbi:MAG: hypothetical protein HY361_04030 [Candidatus Aenigmarchaeota archaeon]|nr:hypothetical protein [Candidatus Aenigmarchaeota archaeon]